MGYACDVIPPSLFPKRPGVQQKHDKRDASELARLYRAGELTPVRISSEQRTLREAWLRDIAGAVSWPTLPMTPEVAREHPLGHSPGG
jgi:transposase